MTPKMLYNAVAITSFNLKYFAYAIKSFNLKYFAYATVYKQA